MTAVDRTTAVLSIRPEYVGKILAGTKTVEFRRKPLPAQVETVLIWRTRGGGGFVGQFTVGSQERADACYWNHQPGIGIAFPTLVDYAGGMTEAISGIHIRNLIVFPRTYSGWELGTERAPQSWRYAHADWRDALLEAAKS